MTGLMLACIGMALSMNIYIAGGWWLKEHQRAAQFATR